MGAPMNTVGADNARRGCNAVSQPGMSCQGSGDQKSESTRILFADA